MIKAEVHRPDGTLITIEGSEDEVRGILSALHLSKSSAQQVPTKRRARKSARQMTIPAMLRELKEEHFFDSPRSLVEIKSALAEKGHHYPVTTLSAQVIRQVRNRNLARVRKESKWMYVMRQ